MLLIFLLLSATTSATTPTIAWEQPLKPGLDPSDATVVLAMTEGDERELMESISHFAPDGVIHLRGPTASKENIEATATMLRDYKHVLVYSALRGVGGEADDGQIIPTDGNPDKPASNIRGKDFMRYLTGSQEWIGVLTVTSVPRFSDKGDALIGPDAEQWKSAFLPGMSGFVIASNDVGDVPGTCEVTFGRLVGGGLIKGFNKGTDLTVGSLLASAKEESGVVSSCGFRPEITYAGNASAATVILMGSGVPPASTTVATVDEPKPETVKPIKVKDVNAEKRTKTAVTVASFATAGVCAGLAAWQHAEYATGLAERNERFADNTNFADEAEHTDEWEKDYAKLAKEGNEALALYGCSALATASAVGFTFLLDGNRFGFGLNIPF